MFASNGDSAWFVGMLVLPVTPAGSNKEPAVQLYQANCVANLHGHLLWQEN
jgi:hypothetical protein